jgi:hypothetical protein
MPMVNYTLMVYQLVYQKLGNTRVQFGIQTSSMLGCDVVVKNYKMFALSISKKTSQNYKKLSRLT